MSLCLSNVIHRETSPPHLKYLQSELFNCIIILLFHRFLDLHPVIPEHLFSLLPPLEHPLLTGIHGSPSPHGASPANRYTRIPLLPLEHPMLTGIHGSHSYPWSISSQQVYTDPPSPPLEHLQLTGIYGSPSPLGASPANRYIWIPLPLGASPANRYIWIPLPP